MISRYVPLKRDPHEAVSRRTLLKGAGALTVVAAASASSNPNTGIGIGIGIGNKGTILVYVDTCIPNFPISRTQLAPSSGDLIGAYPPESKFSSGFVLNSTTTPSWISFDPSQRFLYLVDEISNLNSATTGAVAENMVDGSSGNTGRIIDAGGSMSVEAANTRMLSVTIAVQSLSGPSVIRSALRALAVRTFAHLAKKWGA